jgi:hypothetical protein
MSVAYAASDVTVPIRAEMSGTRDCPAVDAFLSAVQGRTEFARRARGGELGWSATLTVKAVGDRRLARLTLKAAEGEWIERELVAPNCEDALEALAVVMAVLVDSAVEQSKAEAARATNSSGGVAGAPYRAPKPIALPRVAAGVYIPWLDDPDYFDKRGISLSSSRFIGSVFGGIELDTQVARHAALGMSLGFDVARWHPSLLRPRFGLGIGWETADVAGNEVTARLQVWSLRAHLCPFEFVRNPGVSLAPCVRTDAGYIYTEMASSPLWPARRGHVGMVRVAPYLRAAFQPDPGIQLWLDGGVTLGLVRREMAFEGETPSQFVHAPAAVGAYAALSVALEF